MRLTADLIKQAPRSINPLKETELLLRNLSILYIENLGVTENYYACIDLSHNQISRLGNCPTLHKLTTVLISNNRVSEVDTDIGTQLPNLTTLVLTNNSIPTIHTLTPLKQCKHLTHISLMNNPVSQTTNYRLNVIAALPQLRVLDFQRIKTAERKAAANVTLPPPSSDTPTKKRAAEHAVNGDADVKVKKQKLLEQIKNTKSLAELQRLEAELDSLTPKT